ncbi:PREDICTED: uncharacterized protein LOC109163328 [Ipomoea nil]|uniref:uncharacterized protein LOC109163328 n=1 Tax=Ipomoea nil TaxID=35883 RepID=UPI00090156AC|nr:PREDICTED: uncharacterized protein LOC109163328 [Ipomoea nil]
MTPCKALGPNGFTAGFYQKAWSIVGGSLLKLVQKFFEDGFLPEGTNDTFISPIPKVDNLEVVKQFRPIGLCNVHYKLITKSMTSRMKNISRKLVGQNQTSFVPGRSITENILVYQEVLHSMRTRRGNLGWLIMKIDLEKAYDRLSWSFIYDTLNDIGFNHAWRRNINECISTSRLSVLWNGQHTEWFRPGRGIRQGDPLSPLLFVLCIERFSHIIQESKLAGRWKGISIARNAPLISHLFFADDLILFGEATLEQAVEMKNCLDWFCSLFATVTDLGNYLGLPSQHGRLKKESFAGFLERMQTIADLFLSQTTLMSAGLIDSMEKLIKNFLWGSKVGERRCNLVKWDMVTNNKSSGWLGIRKLEPMNRAFLAKLGWKLLQNDNCLWTNIFRAKYSASSMDYSTWRSKANSSNTWRGILRARPILQEGIRKQVRNGKGTLFWQDKWIEDRPLKDMAVAELADLELGRTVATFIIFDEPEANDSIGWSKDISGIFTISSAYDIATGASSLTEAAKWNSIWKLKVPNRIRSFLWLVAHGRIMTNSNRVKRGLTTCDKCWACDDLIEDVDHVLRSYPAAKDLCKAVFPDSFQRRSMLPFSIWLLDGLASKSDGKGPLNASSLFAITLWWIWKWRNEAVFNNNVKPLCFKISWVKAQYEEVNNAFMKGKGLMNTQNLPAWRQLRWEKPQEDFAKPNVDGSVQCYTNKASCGGLIRDSSESWIQGFVYNIGSCSPLEAEAWAILKGVQLAIHMGNSRIIIESDSADAVKFIKGGAPLRIPTHNILAALFSGFQYCSSCYYFVQSHFLLSVSEWKDSGHFSRLQVTTTHIRRLEQELILKLMEIRFGGMYLLVLIVQKLRGKYSKPHMKVRVQSKLQLVSQKNMQNNKHKKGTSLNMSKTGAKNVVSNSKPATSRPARSKEKLNKGIRCYECEGFGHVRAECPTYLRRKKSMTATTWSDDEPESETADSDAEEMFGNFVAFTARSTTCSEPGDASDTEDGDYNSAEDLEIPDLSYEVEFNKLYPKWEEKIVKKKSYDPFLRDLG